jgi:GAF domain/PilZ domain/Sel1 repeat
MEPTGPNLAGISRQFRIATERRHTLRHRTHSPAYATWNSSEAHARDLNEILDISEGGMSIQTSSPLQADHDLNLCLDLSETRTRIQTSGQVVWSDTSGRVGIRFAKMSRQALGQLKEWFFVNVLTAFDHASATSTGADDSKSSSHGLLSSHTMAKEEAPPGTPAISGHDRNAAEAEASPRTGITQAGARRTGVARDSATERESEVERNGFDRETMLQMTAERALTLTRATGAAIALSEGNDSEMICVASAGSDAPPFGARLQVGSGFSGECVRTGRCLRCDDSETDDRVDREGCKALGIRSMVAVPIRPGSKVAGLLEVFSPQPYAFNADDIGALQQLTGSIVSIMVRGKTAPASPRPVQKAPATQTFTARSQSRPVVERRAPQVKVPEIRVPEIKVPEIKVPEIKVAEVRVVDAARPVAAVEPLPSAHRSLHKVLLVAAIGTFVFALLWLVAPWFSSTVRSSQRTASHAQSPQVASPKSPNLPASAGDLAGLRKLAEHGDPAAQFALGARYATGEEVQQDYTEAVRWFTLAAEQGHILAQATLGAYYWAGRGVPQDLTKAYYWSVLAQAGGDQASKYRVAVLTSRMSRGQVVAAQQQADDWLRNFAGRAPATP